MPLEQAVDDRAISRHLLTAVFPQVILCCSLAREINSGVRTATGQGAVARRPLLGSSPLPAGPHLEDVGRGHAPDDDLAGRADDEDGAPDDEVPVPFGGDPVAVDQLVGALVAVADAEGSASVGPLTRRLDPGRRLATDGDSGQGACCRRSCSTLVRYSSAVMP
jgi:hypothetical protein